MVVLETCPSNKYQPQGEIMKQHIAIKNAQKIEFCCLQSFILREALPCLSKTMWCTFHGIVDTLLYLESTVVLECIQI